MTPIADMVERMLAEHVSAELIVLAIRNAELPVTLSATLPVTLPVTRSRKAINQANYRARLQAKAKANDVAMPVTQAVTQTVTQPVTAVTPHSQLTSFTDSQDGNQEVSKGDRKVVVEGRKRGTRLSPDWQPRDEDRKFVSDLGLDATALRDEFVDFWIAVPGSRGLKLNWFSTYRNRAREIAGRRKGAVNGSEPIRDKQRRETAEALDQLRQFAKSNPNDKGGSGPISGEHARLLPFAKPA